MSEAKIAGLSASSPLLGLDVRAGDVLIAVNGTEPTDIVEYQQLIDGSHVRLTLQRPGAATTHEVSLKKNEGDPLGLLLDSPIFDRIRTCDNHCTFCFIYQLPTGLRRSLYVKDDDYRLSFLYGNYTTLTRFNELDIERVIDEKLSPLYVSIHATNPSTRASLLRNPRGATSLRWLDALLNAGIEVHGQVVLCPGLNDGDELEATLLDCLTKYERLASVSVVPVGISDFSNEPSLRPLTVAEARNAIEIVQAYREIARKRLGRTLFEISDEMFLLAELEPPEAEYYESLEEAENGVGMFAAFRQSFLTGSEMVPLGSGFFQSVDGAPAFQYRAVRSSLSSPGTGPVVILTGEYAAPLLRKVLQEAHVDGVSVVPVQNRFFGGNIKVTGLLTATDLNPTLEALPEDCRVLIPDVCLSEGRFLDGLALHDLVRPVEVVSTTGAALREQIREKLSL